MTGDPWVTEQTFVVTPSLFLWMPPRQLQSTSVGTASEAADVIRAGGRAVLPLHRWDLASETLRLLGVDKAQRVRQLQQAQCGHSIPVERLTEPQLDAALQGVSARAGQGGCVCSACGYFVAATLDEMTRHPDRYLPESCPVCSGRGFD
jgi:hypothetical protein